MHRLADFLNRVVLWVRPIAESMGGPGLLLVAFLDSSFLSLPEIADALIVLLVIHHPSRWLYYGVMTTLGSVAGCYALFMVGKKGGEAFLKKRMNAGRLDRGLGLFRRFGLLVLIIPSILPPPAPFKIFVLLAGVAKVPTPTFLLAISLGRGFRYLGEAWLAYRYGEQATAFIQDNLPVISLVVAIGVTVLGVAFLVWRYRRRRRVA